MKSKETMPMRIIMILAVASILCIVNINVCNAVESGMTAELGYSGVKVTVNCETSEEAVLVAGVYYDNILCRCVMKDVLLKVGDNTYTMEIGAYTDSNTVKCYLLSEVQTLKPLANSVTAKKMFSDGYEPFYPSITAKTLSTEDIYLSLTSEKLNLSNEQRDTRINVINMYRDAGFNLSQGITDAYTKRNIMDDAPTSWSKKTKGELSGNYTNVFSIDACWNVKIPFDAPSVLLNSDSFATDGLQIAVVGSIQNPGGQGMGTPIFTGGLNDGKLRIATRWQGQDVSTFVNLPIKTDFSENININASSDRHAVFIDTDKNIAFHSYKNYGDDGQTDYSFDSGLLSGYDARCTAISYPYEVDGIGAEGRAGVNATRVPQDAFTIKSDELKAEYGAINHALAGAVGRMLYGRVYPAVTTDNKAMDNAPNVGALPYGGVAFLDKSIDLDSLYEQNKLSLPAKKILKAMQEYGFYNIDQTGGTRGPIFYTSTVRDDWLGGSEYNVPYMGGKQGYMYVEDEIEAFFSNNSFFGLPQKVNIYATIPVVKYALLDTDGNGIINNDDMKKVVQNSSVEINANNYVCDVNQDGIIDNVDAEIYNKYFTNLPYHNPEYVQLTYNRDDDFNNGKILISGENKTNTLGAEVLKNKWIVLSAMPNKGYEFECWTGDVKAAEDNVVIYVDRPMNFGVKYKQKMSVNIDIQADSGGSVDVSRDGKNYKTSVNACPKNDMLEFRAVPESGYTFSGWETDNICSIYPILTLTANQDITVKAHFKKQLLSDIYDLSSWDNVFNKSTDYYSINEDKSNIRFKSSDGFTALVNKTVIGDGSYVYRARINATTTLSNKNYAVMIYDYIDDKNYSIFKIGACGGNATLTTFSDGVAAYNNVYTGDTVFTRFPIDIEIIKKDNKVSVYGYKCCKTVKYFENIGSEAATNTKIGLGNQNHSYVYFENISLSEEE